MSWNSVRELFPASRVVTYLDTAAYGPGPTPVYEAVERALRAWSEGHGDWRAWERSGERARRLFAELLGVESTSVALLPTVSQAAAQVAERLEVRAGANLVVGAEEFRSNLYPWLAQERRGFEIRAVPFEDGRLAAEAVVAALDANTVAVAVSHVQSASGHRIDVETVAAACRARGAALFLDATQSVGALAVPVESVDWLAVAAYKWLLAPRGAAFLYVRPERCADLLPLAPGWKSPADPHAGYYGAPLDLAGDASRYDLSLAWPSWVGVERALELILEVGPTRIHERNRRLTERFHAGLDGRAGPGARDTGSAIVGLPVRDPERLRRNLAKEGVVAAVRGDRLRLSFHFFNDEDDVDRALFVLGS